MYLLMLIERENKNESGIMVGMISCPLESPSSDGSSPSSGGDSGVGSHGELRVYTRRQKQQHESPHVFVSVPTNVDVSSSSSLVPSSSSPLESRGNKLFLDTSTPALSYITSRVNAGKPPAKFSSWETDIANYISYTSIPHAYKSFIASLHIDNHCIQVSVPNNWQVAKQDPRWLSVMQEELQTLKKNDTW